MSRYHTDIRLVKQKETLKNFYQHGPPKTQTWASSQVLSAIKIRDRIYKTTKTRKCTWWTKIKGTNYTHNKRRRKFLSRNFDKCVLSELEASKARYLYKLRNIRRNNSISSVGCKIAIEAVKNISILANLLPLHYSSCSSFPFSPPIRTQTLEMPTIA